MKIDIEVEAGSVTVNSVRVTVENEHLLRFYVDTKEKRPELLSDLDFVLLYPELRTTDPTCIRFRINSPGRWRVIHAEPGRYCQTVWLYRKNRSRGMREIWVSP